jgi:hypothetical protein
MVMISLYAASSASCWGRLLGAQLLALASLTGDWFAGGLHDSVGIAQSALQVGSADV